MPGAPSDGLLVSRDDLAHALNIVSTLMGKQVAGASLWFEDDHLCIEAGKAIAKAPAKGTWPLVIVVNSSWVRRLSNSIPPGDPVSLQVEDGRLYVNRYSEPCECGSEKPLFPALGEVDENRRILEASRILKPFLVKKHDLDVAVEEARTRSGITWRGDEVKMISAVAKAWELLAPLGIETKDLRQLIDRAVRNAWTANNTK